MLLEGLDQAQVLLKTLAVDGLPNKVEQLLSKSNIPDASDQSVRNSILTANLFDAEQKKLAIRKDPNRPAYVLPRDYGITDSRRMYVILFLVGIMFLKCKFIDLGNSYYPNWYSRRRSCLVEPQHHSGRLSTTLGSRFLSRRKVIAFTLMSMQTLSLRPRSQSNMTNPTKVFITENCLNCILSSTQFRCQPQTYIMLRTSIVS